MSKYGLQRRKQQRKDAKNQVVDLSIPWTIDQTEPLDRQDLSDQVSATSRIIQRTKRYQRNNMLVQFAVVYSVFIDKEWIERLCIDTCNHGTVHRHRDGDHQSEPELIRLIRSPRDIQECVWDAVDEAYDLLNEEEGR
jgi:hypothetical protein